MAASSRRPQDTGLFATERPPRLILRFAIVLSLALGLASALILFVVYHFAITEAERAATKQASLVSTTLLQREVQPQDLERAVPPARRRTLDGLFRNQLLAADILRVSLVRADGLVTYSTHHRTIGTRASGLLASEAAAGTIVSRTSRVGPEGGKSETKTLETYTPVTPGSGGGAAVIIQSYAPIHSAARSAQLRVGGVLEALLLVLFIVFMPLLVRVTSRIRQQIEQIHTQAFYDDLTGLPNRTHLYESLRLAVRRAGDDTRSLAVLLLDLDRFREINDTLGHEAGDILLRETAGRLRAAVGGEQLLARLGGDEFVVVTELESEDAVTSLAEVFRSAVEPAVVVDGLPLAIEATVGIAFFPKDGENAETLLRHAEIATYTAKEWRVGSLAYTPAVDPHDAEQLELASALREAAEQGQLRLHYQPKIDLASNEIVGVEGLAYWDHPTRGLLPPGAFIPIAERTGAIRHITGAVLTIAVEQLQAWPDKTLSVAVNLTAIDLLDNEFPQRLSDLLDKHGVDPSRLCIELTESTVMADPERSGKILERIGATGVRVSIDDFGTGHSSLAYLKNLPVHEMKIDRSFISDLTVSLHDRMIATAAIQLGHSLGLTIVAEGVETPDVHNALRGLGCDVAQGYLYARPLPPDELETFLQTWGPEALTGPEAPPVTGLTAAVRLGT
jgi:diguanylate cyclase (GGDEF)-like protein